MSLIGLRGRFTILFTKIRARRIHSARTDFFYI